MDLAGVDCSQRDLISVKDLIEERIATEIEVKVKRKSMFGDDEVATLNLKPVLGWSGPGLTGLALKCDPIF